ncbi:hypothetical protein SAMN06295912_1429 [Sphingomonas laterariae]|uniref:Uncharacterized protein n=1 Tax=Edaphosphingomonas laterariae TaxID=861865 RepID=A0A239JXW4_9SPHN|nr:glycosyltransferase family 39 protein [Sphingomonas laterariae]SNT10827.1 hypothetical protein SAMN06295912_1429 [Sphingomonas laterariae]
MTLIRRHAIAILAILALATAAWFRIRGTLAEPLWLDEAYSAYAASKRWDFLWHVVPRYETHPPFYYSLLRGWTLIFGDSLAALRALGIVCGLLLLPAIGLAAREAARMLRLPALPVIGVAVAFAALWPVLVEMSREVRPYPVLILVYAMALFALIRTARIADGRPRIPRVPFALYILCLALILWLHNLGPLYAAALGLAAITLLAHRGMARNEWKWLIGGHGLAAFLYLPAFLILIDQAPTWVKSTWLRFSFNGMPPKLAELYASQGAIAMLSAATLALLAVPVLAGSTRGRRLGIALFLAALFPVAASILISLLVAPVFIIRTMTAVAVPTILILAIGTGGHVGARTLWRWPALGALLLLTSQMLTVDMRRRAGPPMQDWYNALKWLGERYRPGDVVWAYPNEGALPFDYAARDLGLAVVTRPIPTAVPTLDGGPGAWNPTGSRGVVSLPAERLEALAAAPEATRVPTIWLLRLGANAYDKGDHLLDALESRRVRIADCESYPIDIIGLTRPELVTGHTPLFPARRARCLPGK